MTFQRIGPNRPKQPRKPTYEPTAFNVPSEQVPGRIAKIRAVKEAKHAAGEPLELTDQELKDTLPDGPPP